MDPTSATSDMAEFASATSPCGKQTDGFWPPSCQVPALHRQRVKLEATQSLPVAEEIVSAEPQEYQPQHPSHRSHPVLPGDRD